MAWVAHWSNTPGLNTNKTMFLEKVTGFQIVEEQDKINVSDKMMVVATTIIPLIVDDGKVGVNKVDDEGHTLCDCYIYYKVSNELTYEETIKKKGTISLDGAAQ